MRLRFLTLAVAVSIAAAACGGSDGTSTTSPGGNPNGGGNNPPPAPIQTNQVSVGDDFFSPAAIQVPVGTTVTWTWSNSGIIHNVTFPDGTSSGDQSSSATFSKTFSTAGTFGYLCTLHNMSGSVLVK